MDLAPRITLTVIVVRADGRRETIPPDRVHISAHPNQESEPDGV